jgi:hypothetical protein
MKPLLSKTYSSCVLVAPYIVRLTFAATYLLLVAGSIPFSLLYQASSVLQHRHAPQVVYHSAHVKLCLAWLLTVPLVVRYENIISSFVGGFSAFSVPDKWGLGHLVVG